MSQDFGWANIKNAFRSRSQRRASLNLGIIDLTNKKNQQFRKESLEKADAYFENRQYENLPEWDVSNDSHGAPLPVRKRQPRFKFAFAKTLSQRVTAKLLGASVFPTFSIEESPEDSEFIKAVIRESKLKSFISEPIRRLVNTGSVFIRFYLSGGTIKLEWYHAKFCYPKFQPNGELASLEIKYTFEDKSEKDALGNYKRKWFKMELNTMSEIMFDNPEFVDGQEPEFVEVARLEHGLGFVQGEWFRTCQAQDKDDPDGYGFVSDITDFIDEINYSLSQSSQAVGYNQDPQLAFKGMDESELGNLIRSSLKAWNMGREGEASFIESNLTGVERAIELRDKIKLNIQDITRIVMLDPEKIVGSAQSAKAMEVLHGPLKDLIDELRLSLEPVLKNLVLKMSLLILIANRNGMDVPLEIPAGYAPKSLALELDWPPIFQQTMEDLQKKVQVVSAATSANLISRESGTRFLAKDFGIENVDEEIQKIAAQPIINPFGGF